MCETAYLFNLSGAFHSTLMRWWRKRTNTRWIFVWRLSYSDPNNSFHHITLLWQCTKILLQKTAQLNMSQLFFWNRILFYLKSEKTTTFLQICTVLFRPIWNYIGDPFRKILSSHAPRISLRGMFVDGCILVYLCPVHHRNRYVIISD